MIIKNIRINNFRLLRDIDINLYKNTTSIVGKNNSGKTSFSEIFNIFMNNSHIKFDDFSLESHREFEEVYYRYTLLNENNQEETITFVQSKIPKITLTITLEYSNEDNWTNLKPFITSLNNENRIQIVFEYKPKDSIKLLAFIKSKLFESTLTIIDILKSHISEYYTSRIRPLSLVENTEEVTLKQVKNLMQCYFIHAQRQVDDSNSTTSSKLSEVFQQQYEYVNDIEKDKTDELSQAIDSANLTIDDKLKDFFDEFIKSFSSFGFPNIGSEKLELKSELVIERLFKNNVKLFYNHDNSLLPEKYNGLGYSNLIYIISKILSFQIENKNNSSDLNLIFIEEPEAHMHPQMQGVFIEKINKFLEEKDFNVQLVITTHSSHILANTEFESIRYFMKNGYSSKIKDLMNFNPTIDSENTIKFLKQYLTLGKSELFFADKAILFEGVVERLLLPAFIRKVDNEITGRKLSEQYISSIEIGGAYMNKFKELLEFLELKTLIITDIDPIDAGSREKTNVKNDNTLITSNSCLKNWIPEEENILNLLAKNEDDKIKNNIRVAYQTNVLTNGIKCGRSFEEAFIIDNNEYIFNNKDSLLSIKNHLNKTSNGYLNKDTILDKSYDIHSFIDRNSKKTEFAFDLVAVEQEDWITPEYIKEGLIWLAK